MKRFVPGWIVDAFRKFYPKLETERVRLQKECLFCVQIPTDDVPTVLDAVISVTPLRYGRYKQVVFRQDKGMQQFEPLVGSKTGEAALVHIECDQISFTVPCQDEVIVSVIDAIFESHPHEEPVIHLQEVYCTRFNYDQENGQANGQAKAIRAKMQ